MKKFIKPEVTLIVSSSVDGCLIGRDSDQLDQDKNWKNSPIVRGMVQQFYDFTNNTDVFNLTTADVMLNIGINDEHFTPKKDALNLIVLDMLDQLKPQAVLHLAASVEKLVILTGSERKDFLTVLPANCHLLSAGTKLQPFKIMKQLSQSFGIRKVTIQSAGQLNSEWLNANIVDYLTVVVYPLIVSSNGTGTFPPSSKLQSITVKPLQLIAAQPFDTHYVSLRYKVINT